MADKQKDKLVKRLQAADSGIPSSVADHWQVKITGSRGSHNTYSYEYDYNGIRVMTFQGLTEAKDLFLAQWRAQQQQLAAATVAPSTAMAASPPVSPGPAQPSASAGWRVQDIMASPAVSASQPGSPAASVGPLGTPAISQGPAAPPEPARPASPAAPAQPVGRPASAARSQGPSAPPAAARLRDSASSAPAQPPSRRASSSRSQAVVQLQAPATAAAAAAHVPKRLSTRTRALATSEPVWSNGQRLAPAELRPVAAVATPAKHQSGQMPGAPGSQYPAALQTIGQLFSTAGCQAPTALAAPPVPAATAALASAAAPHGSQVAQGPQQPSGKRKGSTEPKLTPAVPPAAPARVPAVTHPIQPTTTERQTRSQCHQALPSSHMNAAPSARTSPEHKQALASPSPPAGSAQQGPPQPSPGPPARPARPGARSDQHPARHSAGLDAAENAHSLGRSPVRLDAAETPANACSQCKAPQPSRNNSHSGGSGDSTSSPGHSNGNSHRVVNPTVLHEPTSAGPSGSTGPTAELNSGLGNSPKPGALGLLRAALQPGTEDAWDGNWDVSDDDHSHFTHERFGADHSPAPEQYVQGSAPAPAALFSTREGIQAPAAQPGRQLLPQQASQSSMSGGGVGQARADHEVPSTHGMAHSAQQIPQPLARPPAAQAGTSQEAPASALEAPLPAASAGVPRGTGPSAHPASPSAAQAGVSEHEPVPAHAARPSVELVGGLRGTGPSAHVARLTQHSAQLPAGQPGVSQGGEVSAHAASPPVALAGGLGSMAPSAHVVPPPPAAQSGVPHGVGRLAHAAPLPATPGGTPLSMGCPAHVSEQPPAQPPRPPASAPQGVGRSARLSSLPAAQPGVSEGGGASAHVALPAMSLRARRSVPSNQDPAWAQRPAQRPHDGPAPSTGHHTPQPVSRPALSQPAVQSPGKRARAVTTKPAPQQVQRPPCIPRSAARKITVQVSPPQEHRAAHNAAQEALSHNEGAAQNTALQSPSQARIRATDPVQQTMGASPESSDQGGEPAQRPSQRQRPNPPPVRETMATSPEASDDEVQYAQRPSQRRRTQPDPPLQQDALAQGPGMFSNDNRPAQQPSQRQQTQQNLPPERRTLRSTGPPRPVDTEQPEPIAPTVDPDQFVTLPANSLEALRVFLTDRQDPDHVPLPGHHDKHLHWRGAEDRVAVHKDIRHKFQVLVVKDPACFAGYKPRLHKEKAQDDKAVKDDKDGKDDKDDKADKDDADDKAGTPFHSDHNREKLLKIGMHLVSEPTVVIAAEDYRILGMYITDNVFLEMSTLSFYLTQLQKLTEAHMTNCTKRDGIFMSGWHWNQFEGVNSNKNRAAYYVAKDLKAAIAAYHDPRMKNWTVKLASMICQLEKDAAPGPAQHRLNHAHKSRHPGIWPGVLHSVCSAAAMGMSTGYMSPPHTDKGWADMCEAILWSALNVLLDAQYSFALTDAGVIFDLQASASGITLCLVPGSVAHATLYLATPELHENHKGIGMVVLNKADLTTDNAIAAANAWHAKQRAHQGTPSNHLVGASVRKVPARCRNKYCTQDPGKPKAVCSECQEEVYHVECLLPGSGLDYLPAGKSWQCDECIAYLDELRREKPRDQFVPDLPLVDCPLCGGGFAPGSVRGCNCA